MRYVLSASIVVTLVYAGLSPSQADPGAAHTATNPLAFNISTIKRGKQLYAVHCIRCHGADGRGDTEMREFLKTPPADLSDELWLYGDSDAAVFDVVRSGRTERDMPAFEAELDDEGIWQVVSFMRYLGGRRP